MAEVRRNVRYFGRAIVVHGGVVDIEMSHVAHGTRFLLGELQRWLLGGGRVGRFLEDVDLHSLPAQYEFQIVDAFPKPEHTDLRRHIGVGLIHRSHQLRA